MRRTVRTIVLASTAAIAAAVGAVAMAPIASAQEDESAPMPFGSSELQSPDLVVSIDAVCVPRAEEDDREGELGALEITLNNVGADAASLISTNYGIAPDLTGVLPEDVIEPGEGIVYTVPTPMSEWNNVLAGAATFSPQLDANYPDNFAVGMLSIDCS